MMDSLLKTIVMPVQIRFESVDIHAFFNLLSEPGPMPRVSVRASLVLEGAQDKGLPFQFVGHLSPELYQRVLEEITEDAARYIEGKGHD